MSDDLVKRLKQAHDDETLMSNDMMVHLSPTLYSKAADRIEELEAALHTARNALADAADAFDSIDAILDGTPGEQTLENAGKTTTDEDQ